jgi:catechol-2,3-dioxygenase
MNPEAVPIDLDHSVLAVSDWDRSNAFYRDVLGAEIPRRRSTTCEPTGWRSRSGR